MNTHTFFMFIGTSLMVAIVPGPNVILVLSRVMAHGFKCALPLITGFVSAALIYLMVTIAGLTAIVAALPKALTALRVLGACYLLYIGLRMMRASLLKRSSSTSSSSEASRTSLYAQGFWTSFSNPKTMLYWSAFLPQFIDSADNVASSMVILGITGISLEAIVLVIYAALALAAHQAMGSSHKARILEFPAGAVLAALGASLGWNLIGSHRS